MVQNKAHHSRPVSSMPSSTSRPRGYTSGSSGSGRSAPNTPMSERQQMALLMQMTSSTNQAELSPGGSGPARSRDRNERGETAMHVAAIKGDAEGVKKLLDQGMDPNVADFAGWTPLHEACNHGHYNVALTLVKAGANVNARGLDDDTPLHDAAKNGQYKLVKMLVERGADPSFKNRRGKTPCDVAAATVSNYLISAKDSASGRSQQQMKKTSESKKSLEESEETSNTASGSGSGTAKTSNKEDDVYEFKTTPKDSSSSSGDDKSDGGKSSDKSSDEKGDEQSVKRSYSDVEGDNDEDTKRKKRKEGESSSKESSKGSTSSRSSSQRQEKGSKNTNISSKSTAISNKVPAAERKSPSGSPKPAQSKSTDSDADEDKSSGEGFGVAGPKVPPLKIVIPQQNTNTDQEIGTRNGKNTSARGHAALPYVVASSSNSNDSADKETIPELTTESTKSAEERKTSGTMTNDEQRQQRVLRSHRGGQSVDRGSNNSSPQQLQSTSPSPAPTTSTISTTTATTTSSTSTTTTSSTTDTTESSAKPSGNNTNVITTSGTSSASPTNAVTSTDAETTSNAPSPSASSTSSVKDAHQNVVDLHPRKRKIRASKDENKQSSTGCNTTSQSSSNNENGENVSTNDVPHPHDQPTTNCYQMYIELRSQIERRHRSLFPVQPKPPTGFKDYLMNRQSYVLAGKTPSEPAFTLPANMSTQLKDLFTHQDKERQKLKMQHIVEKEKLVLAVEQEILRVHTRAARALANQSLPFSACTIMKDDEVYNIITPEQEEKDRNARGRYNGRLFLSWLQDVDDKWEKIKEAMVLRQHNEAESLHAVQKMDWEWKMKELSLCELKAQPIIEETHVPIVHVSDEFERIP